MIRTRRGAAAEAAESPQETDQKQPSRTVARRSASERVKDVTALLQTTPKTKKKIKWELDAHRRVYDRDKKKKRDRVRAFRERARSQKAAEADAAVLLASSLLMTDPSEIAAQTVEILKPKRGRPPGWRKRGRVWGRPLHKGYPPPDEDELVIPKPKVESEGEPTAPRVKREQRGDGAGAKGADASAGRRSGRARKPSLRMGW